MSIRPMLLLSHTVMSLAVSLLAFLFLAFCLLFPLIFLSSSCYYPDFEFVI